MSYPDVADTFTLAPHPPCGGRYIVFCPSDPKGPPSVYDRVQFFCFNHPPNGWESDPDFCVEEGEGAVYSDSALARRVFGWDGRMFPRISLVAYPGWRKDKAVSLEGPGFVMECSYKSNQGQWWREVDVPLALIDELAEMLQEVKTQLSTTREAE